MSDLRSFVAFVTWVRGDYSEDRLVLQALFLVNVNFSAFFRQLCSDNALRACLIFFEFL